MIMLFSQNMFDPFCPAEWDRDRPQAFVDTVLQFSERRHNVYLDAECECIIYNAKGNNFFVPQEDGTTKVYAL